MGSASRSSARHARAACFLFLALCALPALALGQSASPPTARPSPPAVPLSFSEAIRRGLDAHIAARLGRQATRAADGARLVAMSGLLPNVSGRLAETREQINLEAFGFPIPPGTSPIIGPFNVFDARLSVTQTLFDYGAIETYRAGDAARNAVRFSEQDVRDEVVLVCAGLYLRAEANTARVESARAVLRTAEALFQHAAELKSAGMVPGIEVLRAQVQLEAQRQRVIVADNELAKSKLLLARAIGLGPGQSVELTDRLQYAQAAGLDAGEAFDRACRTRSDYRAAESGVAAAEAARKAAIAERLPTVRLTADVGDIGQTFDSSKLTYAVSAGVRVPIFQGGRAKGRLLEADAALEQQRARVEDLQRRIDLEVRTALLDLTAADDRVKVARNASDLAQQQLVQAQDRFVAGVASNIEVVQAQEALAAASENYVSSLFAHNLAKVTLARALGTAESGLEQSFGGRQ